jgi:hypothetical protein
VKARKSGSCGGRGRGELSGRDKLLLIRASQRFGVVS